MTKMFIVAALPSVIWFCAMRIWETISLNVIITYA